MGRIRPMNDEPGLRLRGPIQLAAAQATCWRCQRPTPVHALVAADVEVLEGGKVANRLGGPAFVYDIDQGAMPAGLGQTLAAASPYYTPTFSRTTGLTTWANRCHHCAALQGASFLHSEPDGPFFCSPGEHQGPLELVHTGDVEVDDASYGD